MFTKLHSKTIVFVCYLHNNAYVIVNATRQNKVDLRSPHTEQQDSLRPWIYFMTEFAATSAGRRVAPTVDDTIQLESVDVFL